MPQSARICAIGGSNCNLGNAQIYTFFFGWGFPKLVQVFHVSSNTGREQGIRRLLWWSFTHGLLHSESENFGFLRLNTDISHDSQVREKDPDALLLNAGDYYQGTMWYTFFKYRPVIQVENTVCRVRI